MQQAFDFLCANRHRFPDRLPEISLSDYFVPSGSRSEFIFVGSRQSGKTTWLRQLGTDGSLVGNGICGYDADQDAVDLATMSHKIILMRRFRDTERLTHPNYLPIVTITDTNWERVKSRCHQSIDSVAQVKFPIEAFYAAMKKIPDIPIEAIYEAFGNKFLLAATDARGRLLPKLAYDMVLASLAIGGRATQAKYRGQAAVASKWLLEQRDLARWLIELVPGYKRLVDKQETVSYHMKTVRTRLLSHAFRTEKGRKGGSSRPWGLGVNEYMDYLQAAGVWRVTDKGYVHWSRPYSVGAAQLKLSLTTAAIDAMLTS